MISVLKTKHWIERTEICLSLKYNNIEKQDKKQGETKRKKLEDDDLGAFQATTFPWSFAENL